MRALHIPDINYDGALLSKGMIRIPDNDYILHELFTITCPGYTDRHCVVEDFGPDGIIWYRHDGGGQPIGWFRKLKRVFLLA